MRFVIAMILVLGVSAVILADCVRVKPTYRVSVPYRPRVTHHRGYTAPYRHSYGHHCFDLFDYRVKDVFVFTGPLPAYTEGVVVGVRGDGSEVRLVPLVQAPQQVAPQQVAPQQPQVQAQSKVGTPAPAPSGAQVPQLAQPETTQAQPGKPQPLASLGPACASCHAADGKGGKVKGSFTLIGADGTITPDLDWKAVDAVISGKDGKPARMPPPDSGKPAVSEADRKYIKWLASEPR